MANPVLIVDDSMTIRTQLRLLLRAQNFEVLEAENGEKAIDCIKQNKVGLMLLDMNMPVLDGLGTLKTMQEEIDEADRPKVVILTTENSKRLLEQAREYGVCAWLVKPYKQNKLLDAINRFYEE